MKMGMMIASLRQWDAEIAGESAWRVGTKNMAWRGGGAAEPLWVDLVTLRPAALHPHKELASSLSVGELRM